MVDNTELPKDGKAAEGFVMAPEDPTGEMVLAGERKDEEFKKKFWGMGATVSDVYKAMLSARPKLAAPGKEKT